MEELVKRVKWLVLVTSLVLSSAGAADYQGFVQNVMPYGGSVYVLVGSGGFGASSSSCPFGSTMVYSIDPNTPFGRTLVAVALSAKVTGRLVYAAGNGICSAGSPFGSSSEGLVGMDLKGT